jgi:hypothetical protein
MTQDFNNQVVGLIRFSYPALSGFVKGGEGTAEMEAYLYDPARLERRFRLFEALCLPSLLAQTDTAFTTLFLVGENLPEVAKSHLAELIAPLRDGRIIVREAEHNYAAIRQTFATIPQEGFSHRTSFRLDDDDALANRYIERLKQTARKLEPLCEPKKPVAISFNRGFYLEQGSTENQIYDANERTPLSAGSALFAQAEHPENIYARNHRFLGQFFNHYSDVSEPSFLRTIHQDNDSEPVIVGQSKKMQPVQLRESLEAHFAHRYADLIALR